MFFSSTDADFEARFAALLGMKREEAELKKRLAEQAEAEMKLQEMSVVFPEAPKLD